MTDNQTPGKVPAAGMTPAKRGRHRSATLAAAVCLALAGTSALVPAASASTGQVSQPPHVNLAQVPGSAIHRLTGKGLARPFMPALPGTPGTGLAPPWPGRRRSVRARRWSRWTRPRTRSTWRTATTATALRRREHRLGDRRPALQRAGRLALQGAVADDHGRQPARGSGRRPEDRHGLCDQHRRQHRLGVQRRHLQRTGHLGLRADAARRSRSACGRWASSPTQPTTPCTSPTSTTGRGTARPSRCSTPPPATRPIWPAARPRSRRRSTSAQRPITSTWTRPPTPCT